MTTTPTDHDDLERRRKIQNLARTAAGSIVDAIHIADGCNDLGIAMADLVTASFEFLPPEIRARVAPMAGAVAEVFENAPHVGANLARGVRPLHRTIARLFDEAPKLTDASGKPDETQGPAIPDIAVQLQSGASFQGVLALTPEGGLKLGATGQLNGKPILAEHFFDYDDVECIIVVRPIDPVSRIFGA